MVPRKGAKKVEHYSVFGMALDQIFPKTLLTLLEVQSRFGDKPLGI